MTTLLLQGVVGSTAYGLAGPDSDVDRLGVFAYPTQELLRLTSPPETVVRHEPSDITVHEAKKFLRLALACNPTILELLWLPEYEVETELGLQLVDIAPKLLTATGVRNAYLGYATQQFHKLEARGDGSFSADTRKRTAKHARHMLRLCQQGLLLYSTGELVVRVPDPEHLMDFGQRVASGDLEHAAKAVAVFEEVFASTSPALPDKPDREEAEAWLLRVRAAL